MAKETTTTSSVASLKPQVVAMDSHSNETTVPYRFSSQHPIVPPSLKDLNLSPNPFNVLATMAVIGADKKDSTPSPEEQSIPSPICTPPMKVSTNEGRETTHTTKDDATFCSEDEPGRFYWDISSGGTFDSNEPGHLSIASSSSSTPPPPPRQKIKPSMGMFFPQKVGVTAAHLRGMPPAPTS